MDRNCSIEPISASKDTSYNIISFGKKSENLLRSIETKTIGGFLSTVSKYITRHSIIFLHCNGKIWGKAIVVSDYYFDDSTVWNDKVYPHRFSIDKIQLTKSPLSLSNSSYSLEFKKRYGNGWAYKFIFSPKPIPKEIAIQIDKGLELSSSNSTARMLETIISTSN